MSNTQQDHGDWTADTLHELAAPQRDLIAALRKLEARFTSASETIRQIRPDEPIGNFPSLEGIETAGSGELGVREVFCRLAVKVIEQRAEDLLAAAEQAERVRAENQRRQNMSPLEVDIEGLKRALAYQGSELAKLRGAQQPPSSHVAPSRAPQMLGLPGGVGRPAVGQTAGSGVRKLGTSNSGSGPDATAAGFTRRIHPLEVLGGGSGKR
ncbi:MAG TPA: hypothetical protein VGD75_02960 [Bradyrhizobium sp.]